MFNFEIAKRNVVNIEGQVFIFNLCKFTLLLDKEILKE